MTLAKAKRVPGINILRITAAVIFTAAAAAAVILTAAAATVILPVAAAISVITLAVAAITCLHVLLLLLLLHCYPVWCTCILPPCPCLRHHPETVTMLLLSHTPPCTMPLLPLLHLLLLLSPPVLHSIPPLIQPLDNRRLILLLLLLLFGPPALFPVVFIRQPTLPETASACSACTSHHRPHVVGAISTTC